MTSRFNAPWYAFYIQAQAKWLDKVDASTLRRIGDAFTLSQQLGSISLIFYGRDYPGAVAEFVCGDSITHILPSRSRLP